MKSFKEIIRALTPRDIYEWMSRYKAAVFLVTVVRVRHALAIHRIRAKLRRGDLVTVLFLDSEIAKWKCQSLYEALRADGRFDPIIGLLPRDHSENKSPELRAEMNRTAKDFFECQHCKCIDLYDAQTDSIRDLRKSAPDILFYLQPLNLDGTIGPNVMCRYALTCAVPYFTPNFGFPDIEAHLDYHRYLAYYFLLNKGWCDVYRQGVSPRYFSGEFVPAGHPMLDAFNEKTDAQEPEYVIYAPHFSIGDCCPLKLATFKFNGIEILRYAQRHPEIKWVFKPHPVLRYGLMKYMGYSEEQVQGYYDAWRRIGLVCEEGNYIDLFKRTKALITDCGSFLVEFGATGRPVIHLISSRNNYVPHAPSKRLFATYYDVHSLEEMYRTFDDVLLAGRDPKRAERLAAVREAGLLGTNAAENIMRFLCGEFHVSYHPGGMIR